ncbi:hypothetical protein DRQ25_17240 [Candidatus Fermentibacteria bacterium]|nr:MAG: hypothetical protein DRQ25_17240 [Candidatus Fermentibacteria bacterium]
MISRSDRAKCVHCFEELSSVGGEVYSDIGSWQGLESFFFDGGGAWVVWSVSGKNRRFTGVNVLLREQVVELRKIHFPVIKLK